MLTRLPVGGVPVADLPDPSQRLVRLRTMTRVRAGTMAAGTSLGAAVPLVLLDDSLDEPGLLIGLVLSLYFLWAEWRPIRRRMDAALPLQQPVTIEDLDAGWRILVVIAALAVPAAALVALLSLIDAGEYLAGYAFGYILIAVGLEILVARRERRDARRYYERLELPDDNDLLHDGGHA